MVKREGLRMRLTITFFPDPEAPQLQAPLSVFVQQAAAAKMIGWNTKLNSTVNGFLVSKETVVLRWWKSETEIAFYQTSW